MISKISVFLVVVFGVVAGGCSTRIGDFTAISSKNIYCKETDLTKLPQRQGIEGESIRFWGWGANIKDALDEALEKGGGNLMIDCQLYYVTYPIPIFSFEGYKVRGTVIKVPYASPTGAATTASK
jgi:hypothetical protein